MSKTMNKTMNKTIGGHYIRPKVVTALLALLLLLALVVAVESARTTFPGAKGKEPQQVASSERYVPKAFEKDGDIWLASKMHVANLTPNTTAFNDEDPSVSPDGRKVTFASNRDGEDFEIYTVDVFSGVLQRLTDNEVSDRSPVWSPDGGWISYEAPYFSSPTHTGVFSANVKMSGSDAGRPNLIDDPYIDRHAEVVARYHQGSLR
jgi:dipeptidyl aminopeptidase/acylaminoacyl peptidase